MSDQHNTCEVHNMVVDMIKDINKKEAIRDQDTQVLKENVIKLTENLLELQRNCKKSEEDRKEINKKLELNTSFIYKAIGVVGSISVIAALSPIVLWIIEKIVGKIP